MKIYCHFASDFTAICVYVLRPQLAITRVTTHSSRHVLYYSFKTSVARRPTPSSSNPLSLLLLCDDPEMQRARPISNRQPGVDQSLPLLLRLDLGP